MPNPPAPRADGADGGDGDGEGKASSADVELGRRDDDGGDGSTDLKRSKITSPFH